jgi:dihydroorotate dehydrogenase electron transfer subunit
MKQIQIKTKIVKNYQVGEKYFKAIITAPEIAKTASPGQFVMARVKNSCEPLLRRPLGIHRVCGKNIELLYEIAGRGTEILSQKKSGEYLDIIGPLGNGFDYRLSTIDYRPILIAGGMGVAPLLFLAERIRGHQVTKSPSHKLVVIIGAKTKSHIICEKEFKNLGYDVKIATDDGSAGFKGHITDLLKNKLLAADHRLSTIYACGPKPMLKELARIAKVNNLPAQVSLEAHMACGIGACLGCVVNTEDGFKRVCKDGPVFRADEIVW